MTGSIVETAEDIRSMRVRGAGRLARAAAEALGGFAEGYAGADLVVFKRDLAEARRILLAARPTAVSLLNAVNSAVAGAFECTDIGSARLLVKENADRFRRESKAASEAIAGHGAALLKDGDVVLTHCNSSAAVGVFKEARSRGIRIRSYNTETRPWRQGIITVNELRDAGIDATLIVDSCVATVMPQVTAVFLGADTVAANGDVVNKVGTHGIALIAKAFGVPVYFCAETCKFSPVARTGNDVVIEERAREEVASEDEVSPEIRIFNPVFDRTPAGLITAIITERGLIDPEDAANVSAEMAELNKVLE